MSIALQMNVTPEKVEVMKRELTKGSPFERALTWSNGAHFEYAGTKYYLFGKTETDKTMRDNGLYKSSIQFKLCTDTRVTLGETEPIHEWDDTFVLRFDVIPEEVHVTFSDNRCNLERLTDSKRLFFRVLMSTYHDVIATRDLDGLYDVDFGDEDLDSQRVVEIVVGYKNDDFRWTGKVVHDDTDAFFQALERELEVLDDLDNDEAIVKVLKEAMMKLERPNLIVDITGGAIQEAISSIPVSMCVLDGDLSGEERIKEHDGVLFHHYSESVRYDPDSVEHVNNQPDKRDDF